MDQYRSGRSPGADVMPFELAKLRLQDGAHSSLAYLGFLAGYDYVHQVMEDKDFVAFLRGLMLTEITPGLVAPEGVDLIAYTGTLLSRFANPDLKHGTYQMAIDGSQKLPQCLLGPVRDQLRAGGGIEHLALAIAGWIRYVMGFDEKGELIAVQDPLAERFKDIEQRSFESREKLFDIERLVSGYLGITAVFGRDLSGDDRFKSAVTYWLSQLLANGVATTLKIFLTR